MSLHNHMNSDLDLRSGSQGHFITKLAERKAERFQGKKLVLGKSVTRVSFLDRWKWLVLRMGYLIWLDHLFVNFKISWTVRFFPV